MVGKTISHDRVLERIGQQAKCAWLKTPHNLGLSRLVSEHKAFFRLCLFLLLLSLFSSLSNSYVSAQTPGDANDDGSIDVRDVVAVVDQILGVSNAAGAPDCTQDGEVNILDVTCVVRLILGVILENNPPVLATIGSQTLSLGSTLTLTLSATDPDGDPLTFSASPLPANATLNALTGVFTFSPAAEQVGTFTLTFTVSDGRLTDSETVTIAVEGVILENNPPVLATIGSQTLSLGSTLTLTLSAADPDGDPLTFSASPLPLPANAILNALTGVFTFSPAAEQAGTFTLTFAVSDGRLTDSETVTIAVEGQVAGEETGLTGRLLDSIDFAQAVETPVVGATVSLLGTGISSTSNETGRFLLTGLPAGSQVLDIDTSTADPAADGSAFAAFRESIELIEGVTNVVDRPFFLPRIAGESLTEVDPNATTEVTNPTLRVTLTVPPQTAKNPDGTDFTGQLSISEVPPELAPVALPEELEPGMLITIQPVGVSFSTPVPITFPNIDNLPAGSEVDIWSLDPDAGEFMVVGTGRVSADGSVVETISGGIRAADWHMTLPPPVSSVDFVNNFNQDQKKCCDQVTGSRTAVASGGLTVDHTLASYRSLGQSRALRLVYNSLRADPQPIMATRTTIPVRAAVPRTVSTRLSVAGVDQGFEVFTDTSALSDDKDETIRQVVQFDAGEFPTGLYRHRLTQTSNYARSSVSSIRAGNVLVNNQRNSPFGAGWTLEGLSRLHVQAASILLTEGDGSARVITLAPLGTGAFSAPTNFAVGLQPEEVAVGDFNGDGNLDLATANLRDDVSILLGDGTGAFSAPTNFAVGFGPSSVAVGDFNGDGNLDLAAATSSNSNVSILLGDGTGAFSAPTNFPVGSGPSSVAVADFNGDGNLDLAVANQFNSNVSILLGDGTGAFSAPTNFPAGDEPRSVAVGDFNGDGNLDLATANRFNRNVSILLGDGTGAFSAPTNFAAGSGPTPSEVAVGDFNGDGNLDLAVANSRAFTSLATTVSILLGDGAGAFSAPTNFPAGDEPNSVAVGDFTGDGNLDLAVGNSLSADVSILLGDGTGAFSAPTNFAVGFGPSSVAVGDFTGDGNLDLAVAGGSTNVSILLGEPSAVTTRFLSPAGDFSTLVKNDDGTFTRTLKDGTQINFNAEGLQTSVVDRNGNTTTYSYDSQGRLVAITDPVALVSTLSYTGGKLSSMTDPAGRVTSFQHDAAGNLTQIADPDGSARQFAYDGRHRMMTQTSKRGFATAYEYNFAGRNVKSTLPDGSTRQISPSETVGLIDPATGLGSESNPTPVVRPEDVSSTFTDGNGNVTTYKTDVFGALTERIDPLGRVITTTRDENGNVTRAVQPNGAVLSMTYDDTGNLLGFTNEGIGATVTFTYKPTFNQIASLTDPEGNTGQTTYDGKGNITGITDALGNTTSTVYDQRGLASSATLQNGLTSSFTRDALRNLTVFTDSLGNQTALEYETAGNVVRQTDAEGGTTEFQYDAMNRLIQLTDPTAGVTRYTYDLGGNLVTVTDPGGQETVFQYDAMDRLVVRTNPLGLNEEFSYDANGNLISHIDRNGELIQFKYDAADRPVEKKLPGNVVTTFAYDAMGNLTSVVNPDSRLAMTYDLADRLITVSTAGSLRQPETIIKYTYDRNDNRLAMRDPNGGITTYEYDALNRVTAITNPSGQTTSFTYDELSRKTAVTHANGTATRLAYQGVEQLLSIENLFPAGGTISSFSYTYNQIGNRTGVNQQRSGIDVTSSLTYVYDQLHRLVQATHPLPGLLQQTFSYDLLGNRLRRTGQSVDSVFDAANRLLEDDRFTYAYDANGNLTRKINKITAATTTYTYNAENQLLRIDLPDGGFAEYHYDGLGQRIEKNVNGVITRYVYDLEDILLEFDGVDNVLARYTHALGIDDPLIMDRDTNGDQILESFFYHPDGLGSITEITDEQGGLVRQYVYDAFGSIVAEGGGLVNPYTYTGREFDAESGLYYYRARYYDPTLGRFLQVDPFPLLVFQPQSINPYSYVFNSPMTLNDPSGQFLNLSLGFIGAIGGGVAGFIAGGITAIVNEQPILKSALKGAISGTVAGAMVASSVTAASFVAGALTAGGVQLLDEAVSGTLGDKGSNERMLMATGFGALAGLIPGSGVLRGITVGSSFGLQEGALGGLSGIAQSLPEIHQERVRKLEEKVGKCPPRRRRR